MGGVDLSKLKRKCICFDMIQEGKLEKNNWIEEIEGFYDEDSE